MGEVLVSSRKFGVDWPSSGNLATLLNEAAKIQAKNHQGPGDLEAKEILKNLCPNSDGVHIWSVSESTGGSHTLKSRLIEEWNRYSITVDFTPVGGRGLASVEISYFTDGSIKSFFKIKEECTEKGSKISIDRKRRPIPDGSPAEQSEAKAYALALMKFFSLKGSHELG